jgi:hypothetical protein
MPPSNSTRGHRRPVRGPLTLVEARLLADGPYWQGKASGDDRLLTLQMHEVRVPDLFATALPIQLGSLVIPIERETP